MKAHYPSTRIGMHLPNHCHLVKQINKRPTKHRVCISVENTRSVINSLLNSIIISYIGAQMNVINSINSSLNNSCFQLTTEV